MSQTEHASNRVSTAVGRRATVLLFVLLALVGVALYVDWESRGVFLWLSVTVLPGYCIAYFAIASPSAWQRALFRIAAVLCLVWAAISAAAWPRDFRIAIALPAAFGVLSGGLVTFGVARRASSSQSVAEENLDRGDA